MSAEATPVPGRQRSALAAIYFTVFLDLLGFGILLPAMPFFARELGASGLKLGILISSYSLAQLIGAPILGRLSDRHGRRPVLLTSLAGASLAFVLTGLAQTLFLLCAARTLAGLFGGSVATAQAYIADVTQPEERAQYMGLLGASIGVGFVLGPALGAAFIYIGWGFSGAAFVAAALAALNFALAFWRLPESRTPAQRSPSKAAEGWSAILLRPAPRRLLISTFLAMLAFVAMETTFAYLGEDRFALDEGGFGLILVLVGTVMIVVQGGLVGRLTTRFGTRRIAILGALGMALTLALLPAAPSLILAVAILCGMAAAKGLLSPALATLLSTRSGEDEQGTVLGASQSFAAAARALGPLLAGALYDYNSAAPYLAAALAGVVAASLIAATQEVDQGVAT